MRRTFVCLSCLVVIIACGDSRPSPTPTSPSSPTPTTITAAPCPPCPAPGAYALSGVVRAAGAQIAGAKVGLVKLGPQTPISRGPEELIASVMTDGQGSYSFPRVENVSFSGALVSVSKPGYFIDTKYVQMSGDRQFDFDLERDVDISLGEVILALVGDARCASFGYGGMGGAVCRRFALPLSASGTLEVTLSGRPPSEVDISVLRPDGTIGVNGSSSSPLQVTLPVAAGLTYQIDVVLVNPATREFELMTRMR